ncbi:D-arabinose 5-phosphate isomerase [Escherichia coli]|nr:D-arabinose 5-phosphate isomerase [Escherichia coli]
MSHVELQPGFDFQQAGKEVLAIERECLAELDQYINQNFTLACEKMFWCKGKVVVMGWENRGILGEKWRQRLPAPVHLHFSSILVKPRMVI